MYYFVLDRPQFALVKLYNIRVLLNRANCWNFQIDKRNYDIAVSDSSNRLFFYDLLIIIFVRAKRITIINVVHCCNVVLKIIVKLHFRFETW